MCSAVCKSMCMSFLLSSKDNSKRIISLTQLHNRHNPPRYKPVYDEMASRWRHMISSLVWPACRLGSGFVQFLGHTDRCMSIFQSLSVLVFQCMPSYDPVGALRSSPLHSPFLAGHELVGRRERWHIPVSWQGPGSCRY